MKELFFTSEVETANKALELAHAHAKFRVVGRKHIVVF